jgi:hypothetical protein
MASFWRRAADGLLIEIKRHALRAHRRPRAKGAEATDARSSAKPVVRKYSVGFALTAFNDSGIRYGMIGA